MALTNFSGLESQQLRVWARDLWTQARQASFAMQMAGSGPQAMIQRITELTQTNRGALANITLVPDMTSDGMMGDQQLWNEEESLSASQQTIAIDQIRNAVRMAGKFTEQKHVVRFRETSRDVLGYWLADRLDQLFFLTASSMDFRLTTNGAYRTGFTGTGTWGTPGTITRTAATGAAFVDLAFAPGTQSGTTAFPSPSAKRWFRWSSSSNALVAATNTTYSSIAVADTPSYRLLVELKAYAKDRRIRPIVSNGMETYHVFLHPRQMAKLRLDSDFLANLRNAGIRGDDNPLFSGSVVTVDGLVLHENVHVFNTLNASALTAAGDNNKIGFKWGNHSTTAGGVEGARMLLMGAQAMAFADLGAPSWEEDTWDFGNQNAIALGKFIGFRKPIWTSTRDAGTSEDYGIICVDTAI